MANKFSYEVNKVNQEYGVMEVLYFKDGYKPVNVGVRLPIEGETLEEVIINFAPINEWKMQKAKFVSDISPGIAGDIEIQETAPVLSKEEEIRIIRNAKLMETDWMYLLDTDIKKPSNIDEWSIYRQQLRDITEQPGFPDDIVWPEQPQ